MAILSVITVNLNNRAGLEKTMTSVLNQTFENIEYIVIDGNSTDGSKSLIENYSNRLAYRVSEPDSGIYNAMNKGIRKASGKYCLFLNSGDYLCSEHTLQRVFDHDLKADIVYGNVIFEETNEVVQFPANLTLRQFIVSTIAHPSTFIKTELFQKFGLYNEKYVVGSDLEFFIKVVILENCTTEAVNENISYFNQKGISSQNITLSQKERQEIIRSNIPARILADYNKLFQLEDLVKKNRKKSGLKKLISRINKWVKNQSNSGDH